MKNKHLSYDDRLDIETGLKNNLSFKQIAKDLGKDCTTISKEIKNHIIFKNTAAIGRQFFDCIYRNNCEFRQKGIKCNQNNCSHYVKDNCPKLNKPPYVCNGCNKKHYCTLTKKVYDAEYADNEYRSNLTESRSGITYSEKEIEHLNNILSPLIIDKGQSVHHAYINNENLIMCSEKEIYNLIDLGVFDVRNVHLPRKVRYRALPKRKSYHKIDKDCLKRRKYTDFEEYLAKNPDTNIVEVDTVEGIKGGKVLLTIHFVNCSFMLFPFFNLLQHLFIFISKTNNVIKDVATALLFK